MRKALSIEGQGLTINAHNDPDVYPHSGLSTETSLSTATAFAINHLFDDQMPLNILHQ